MEITVQSHELLDELACLQAIVERKATIPVLANVRLEATGKGLSLLATDLDVALLCRCEADVAVPGVLTVPAKKLCEIIAALPDTAVHITLDRKRPRVTVAADRFEAHLETLPAAEFPAVPLVHGEPLRLPAAALTRMIAHTRCAMTTDDTRYFLNGAQLLLRPDWLGMVATDGHRLALLRVNDTLPITAPADILVPRKVLNELARHVKDVEWLEFAQSDQHLYFTAHDRRLISRKIEANFPAYDRVIPKGNDTCLELMRAPLAAAVRRVRLLAVHASKAITFIIGPGQLEITASSPEIGDAREVLPIEYTGAAKRICLKADYVEDALEVIETEGVALEFKDETTAAVLRPIGAESYDYTHVIMPMRL